MADELLKVRFTRAYTFDDGSKIAQGTIVELPEGLARELLKKETVKPASEPPEKPSNADHRGGR